MMSDSDDTDVLILIPPDLFIVPSSSESDIDSEKSQAGCDNAKTGVISELVEYMQLLENRITAIESKDTSLDVTMLNNSSESQTQSNLHTKFRQTLPRTRFAVSQSSSLQSTPIKPQQSLSLPSTPIDNLSKHINRTQNVVNDRNLVPISVGAKETNTNNYDNDTHDFPISQSSMVVSSHACNMGLPDTLTTHSNEQLYSDQANYFTNVNNICVEPSYNQLHSMSSTSTLLSTMEMVDSYSKVNVPEMELSEVDDLLHEMEATDLELSRIINNVSTRHCFMERNEEVINPNSSIKSKDNSLHKHSINRKLDFENQDASELHDLVLIESRKQSANVFADISLPYNESDVDRSDKMISEFKVSDENVQHPISKAERQSTSATVLSNAEKSATKLFDEQNGEHVTLQASQNRNNVNSANSNKVYDTQTCSTHKRSDTSLQNEKCSNGLSVKCTQYNILPESQIIRVEKKNETPISHIKSIAHASTNTDYFPRKSQRLLSLSDFWETNSNKTQGEIYRIKLEEEKFRREHCEHLIQELQKRLLEQQEKVAVALRVDNEKNQLIAKFHTAWSKLKQRVHLIENEYGTLQANVKTVSEKHKLEISEFQLQIKRYEDELSKALDLAAGYKNKNDIETKEKAELLKGHADELDQHKLFLKEAENKCDKLKLEYDNLIEKNKHNEQTLKTLQQELNKERLKSGEVRNEMNVIHKALDACEAELTILRQEKESLQLKLTEENNRNAILDQKNICLLSVVDDAKKAEKLAKEEAKYLSDQKEKLRLELQEVYQKQVDGVVKVKLQEFQAQLDAAESEFLEELKTRQQVIAECAARKIKDIMDKHRLEINLLEEKHKEEKRLCKLQLAEVLQKSSFLEAQLNSQRTNKSQLAEQLHSVMQKQWQQALQIISGGNVENMTSFQKIHAEKLFESRGPIKSESLSNYCKKSPHKPTKLASCLPHSKDYCDQVESSISTVTPIEDTPLTSRKESKNDLQKYVQMIAEMQQVKNGFFDVEDDNLTAPTICRDVPRKHYIRKESSSRDEDSTAWQAAFESTQDTSEFMAIPQKVCTKGELQKVKPPWK